MAWDVERFKLLESRVLDSVSGRRHVIDVPYYIYLYEPELELECLSEFNALVSRLQTKNVSAESVSLATLMLKSLAQLGCLKETFLRVESNNRPVILEDLERELSNEISQYLKDQLKGKDHTHCEVLLRAGALFPFVHMSSLLTSLEGSVRCTLVLPYPGNKEGEMLNYHGSSIRTYYRGEVI